MRGHETILKSLIVPILSSPSICSKCFHNDIQTIINHVLIKEKCVSDFVFTISKRYCRAAFLFSCSVEEKYVPFIFFPCEKVFVFSINVFTSCEQSVCLDMLKIKVRYTMYHCPRFLISSYSESLSQR